jgi:hypothetical protein
MSRPPKRKREVFSLALQFEQEVTVAPGIRTEVEKFDCPVLPNEYWSDPAGWVERLAA